MFISKLIGPGVSFSGFTILYSYKHGVLAKDCHECNMKRLPKARELPLYNKEDENFTVEFDEQTKMPLISEISRVRQQLGAVMSYLCMFQRKAIHIYETGVAHSQSTYDYVTSEENKIPRIMIISSGGLVGILLARRGGYFKKAFYGSFGAGLVFSAFYPTVAKEYLYSGLEYSKHHTTNILEKYGGYDTKKISEEANAKVENIKNTLKLDSVTNNLNEWFNEKKEALSKSIGSISENIGKSKDVEPDKSTK